METAAERSQTIRNHMVFSDLNSVIYGTYYGLKLGKASYTIAKNIKDLVKAGLLEAVA